MTDQPRCPNCGGPRTEPRDVLVDTEWPNGDLSQEADTCTDLWHDAPVDAPAEGDKAPARTYEDAMNDGDAERERVFKCAAKAIGPNDDKWLVEMTAHATAAIMYYTEANLLKGEPR